MTTKAPKAPIRVVDFDAFRAEQEQKPVSLTYGGREWPLPTALPASVAIGLIRLRADVGDEGEIPDTEIDKFGVDIFGEDMWRELLAWKDEKGNRLTIDEIPVLLQMVLEVYTGEAPKAPESPTSEKSEPSSV